MTPIETAMEALRQARLALYVLTNEKTQALLRQRKPSMPLPALYAAIVTARALVATRKLAVTAAGGP